MGKQRIDSLNLVYNIINILYYYIKNDISYEALLCLYNVNNYDNHISFINIYNNEKET
ncbi:hypothetical protein FACS1894130_02940 [Spirochaetia bacterium]|nr:hypothetical protein FACS1894130_02940 [Spirochaetia bacterium]